MPSVVDLFPGANFQEREVFDFFGVVFDGHPDLRRILMPEDYVGHPQRRDFPMGGEDVLFTFNEHEVPRWYESRSQVAGRSRRRNGPTHRPATCHLRPAIPRRGMSPSDPLAVPYRERERSIALERLGDGDQAPQYGTEVEPDTELFTINMGPHHPATHGVLRLLCTLEGEVVRELTPLIGYVHTGIEKSCEDQEYWKAITFVERMDYLAYYYNATAFCMAVERLLEEEVPRRAQYLRVIHMELNRIASHLFWLGTSALDLGAISLLWYALRDRELILDLFEMSSGQRLHPRYLQVGGVIEDVPPGWDAKVPAVPRGNAGAHRPVRGDPRQERDLPPADAWHRRGLVGDAAGARRHRPAPARLRRAVGPSEGGPVLLVRGLRLQDSGGHGRRPLRPLPRADRRDAGVARDRRAGARRAAGGALPDRATERSRCRRGQSSPRAWRR